jgi:RNA-directed DNA polymerase
VRVKSNFLLSSSRTKENAVLLADEIEHEALKLIRRHERYAKDLADEFGRRNRRTAGAAARIVQRPSYWKVAAGFNPYLVRARHLKIAHSVRASLRDLTYEPRNAVSYEVPKADGTMRDVSVFQVADSAVSRVIFQSLLQKNKQRLSAYSFAYRSDLTVHDAIQHIAADIRDKPRIFVAEYDFSKYFASILHEHIWRTLERQRFLLTEVEQRVLRAFLATPTLQEAQYAELGTPRRTRGVPEGTSVSLFLANVAAWPLDRALERLGVGFARYADDTLIWSPDYARLCEAVDAVNEVAGTIGAELNLRKSEGISILAPEGAPVEFKAKKSVDFVGYSFAAEGISIRAESVKRIKRRLAFLIYRNLLEAPMHGIIVPARFAPPIDRDYVVLIYQMRRYLYGDLNEEKLRKYLRRTVPRVHYKGVMSFYPLVEREDVLRSLDGWLAHTVYTSLRKRASLLAAAGHAPLPEPHGLSPGDLFVFRGKTSRGTDLDMRFPSFQRMARLLRNASTVHGPNAIGHPKSNQYYLGF